MSEGYFTRATLLPSARNTHWYRQALQRGAVYRDHAVVWRLFPGDGLARDFVFRVGAHRNDDTLQYYIVSRRKPVEVSEEIRAEVKPYRPRFSAGEKLAFSLRANPTVSRGVGGTRSKRHDVLMDAKKGKSGSGVQEAVADAAAGWLIDRGTSVGLRFDPDLLRFDRYQQHVSARRGGAALRFSSLDFDGMAVVADPELLTAALFNGVGHSKGFGCGLLMVRRTG